MKLMNRLIFYILLLVVLVSCNQPLKKQYSALSFESDIESMRESQKIPEEDIQLLTKYILVARLAGQDLEGKSYADMLDRLKQLKESSQNQNDFKMKDIMMKRQRLNQLVRVTLIQKEFTKIKGHDYLVYSIVFQNLRGKPIRTIIGNLSLEDLLEKEIKNVYVLFKEDLPAMSSVTRAYQINYNYEDENDKRIRSKNLTDLHIEWNPDKIIYRDGSVAD